MTHVITSHPVYAAAPLPPGLFFVLYDSNVIDKVTDVAIGAGTGTTLMGLRTHSLSINYGSIAASSEQKISAQGPASGHDYVSISADGASNWTDKVDESPSSWGNVCRDWTDANLCWAYWGRAHDTPGGHAVYVSSVYYSTDGGTNWSAISTASYDCYYAYTPRAVIASAHDGNIAYANFEERNALTTTNHIVKVLKDGSHSHWDIPDSSYTHTTNQDGFTILQADPANTDYFYAITASSSNLVKCRWSTNAVSDVGVVPGAYWVMDFVILPSGTFLLTSLAADDTIGLYRSTNQGASWTLVDDLSEYDGSYDVNMRIGYSPNSQIVATAFAGVRKLLISSDDGVTWALTDVVLSDTWNYATVCVEGV